MRARKDKNRDSQKVNESIRAKKVRLIDSDGALVGLVDIKKALERAQEKDLDLIEVGQDKGETIAKIGDYSKYRYQKQMSLKKAKKNQKKKGVHEIKLRPSTAEHDYQFKLNHIKKFIAKKEKVRVTIAFKGREHEHPELGREVLERIIEDLKEEAKVEKSPAMSGRTMSMVLS